MEIEQLKLVLDALSNAGEAGREAFIWWLIASEVLPTVGFIFFVSASVFVIMRFLSFSREEDIRKHRAHSVLKELAEVAGIYGGPYSQHQTIRKLQEFIRKAREAKGD